MVIGLIFLGISIYLFATRTRPRPQVMSQYWCVLHEGYFTLPGAAEYAHCPECYAKFAEFEGEFS